MFKIRIRALVGIMIFFGYFLMYVVRYNVSVHIVEMLQIHRDIFMYPVFNDTLIVRTSSKSQFGRAINTMHWDDMKMSRLFSAYHVGYCICFPIFHNLGDRVGPTWVVGIAGLTSGILNCLTPAATYYNFWAVFTVRTIKGFCAGAMQPSMVQVLSHWVPPTERNYFMWAHCGITTGTCCTFLICAAVHYYSQWPIGFYSVGAVQVLWSALWVFIVTDSPRNHPYIAKDELDYLTNAVGTIFTIKLMNAEAPWKDILRSGPFWTLCILNFGYAWMIISLCIYGPFYYSVIVNLNLWDASAMTALPFILRLILGAAVMQAYHWYKYKSKIKRIKHIRKYFVFVSHVLPGIIVCITWVLPVVPGPVLLTTAVALTAAGIDITLDLCYELTPNFVNSVYTVIKIIGNMSGVILCFCVGWTQISFKNSPYIWKDIWCFHAAILFLSGIVFLIWGETTIQPWNARKIIISGSKRKHPVKKVPSQMSDITEVDEEEGGSKVATSSKKKSFTSLFKSSQIS